MSVSTVTDATAVVRFRIGGLLRFLSHAETLRLLERTLIRADVPIKYTQGFNPHPKLSLPLPRAVGVESDDELLAVRLSETDGVTLGQCSSQGGSTWSIRTKQALAEELPADVIVHSVSVVKSNARFHPNQAQYALTVRSDRLSALKETLKTRIIEIQDSERLTIERIRPNQPQGRRIDVRPFVKSIELRDGCVVAECFVSNAGTIRVDEIMTLLDLTPEDLDGPVRRPHVAWEIV